MNKIFITGLPGSGKSTVLRKVIDYLKNRGLKIGGIITPEIRKGEKRLGFKIIDIHSGKEGILAHVDQKIGPRISKYRVNLEDFEKVALPALDFAIKEADVICIDEISKMEFYSEKFKSKLYEILESDKLIIATLHRSFVNRFREYGQVIEVTKKNRNQLPKRISTFIKASF